MLTIKGTKNNNLDLTFEWGYGLYRCKLDVDHNIIEFDKYEIDDIIKKGMLTEFEDQLNYELNEYYDELKPIYEDDEDEEVVEWVETTFYKLFVRDCD